MNEMVNIIVNSFVSEIVSLIFGLIFGAVIGYKIGISQKSTQVQKAGDNSNQVQISNMNHGDSNGR